jgi:hypothetical protein
MHDVFCGVKEGEKCSKGIKKQVKIILWSLLLHNHVGSVMHINHKGCCPQFYFLEISIYCYYFCNSSLKTYQERQRDWPDEALATLTSYSLVRRCQLQLFSKLRNGEISQSVSLIKRRRKIYSSSSDL